MNMNHIYQIGNVFASCRHGFLSDLMDDKRFELENIYLYIF